MTHVPMKPCPLSSAAVIGSIERATGRGPLVSPGTMNEPAAEFRATRWSIVFQAAQSSEPHREEAALTAVATPTAVQACTTKAQAYAGAIKSNLRNLRNRKAI